MARLIGVIFVAGLLAGCTFDKTPKTVPAEGVVTLDGSPVYNATVIFAAATGDLNASGVTDKEGRFQLRAFDHKSGAVPGDYKVTINKTNVKPASEKPGESNVTVEYGLPQKYASLAKSGLTAQIGEKGDTAIRFDLKSK